MTGITSPDVLAGTAYVPPVRMSRDILGHNRMRWTWDYLDIQQLTGISWDIPGCPSWDYIFRVRMPRTSSETIGYAGHGIVWIYYS